MHHVYKRNGEALSFFVFSKHGVYGKRDYFTRSKSKTLLLSGMVQLILGMGQDKSNT